MECAIRGKYPHQTLLILDHGLDRIRHAIKGGGELANFIVPLSGRLIDAIAEITFGEGIGTFLERV